MERHRHQTVCAAACLLLTLLAQPVLAQRGNPPGQPAYPAAA